MFVEGTCSNLERCLTKIQKDKNKPNVYAKQPHELTHIVDAFRYFASGNKYEEIKVTEKDLYNIHKYNEIVEAIAGSTPDDSFLNY
jgi:hypothetical protein